MPPGSFIAGAPDEVGAGGALTREVRRLPGADSPPVRGATTGDGVPSRVESRRGMSREDGVRRSVRNARSGYRALDPSQDEVPGLIRCGSIISFVRPVRTRTHVTARDHQYGTLGSPGDVGGMCCRAAVGPAQRGLGSGGEPRRAASRRARQRHGQWACRRPRRGRSSRSRVRRRYRDTEFVASTRPSFSPNDAFVILGSPLFLRPGIRPSEGSVELHLRSKRSVGRLRMGRVRYLRRPGPADA